MRDRIRALGLIVATASLLAGSWSLVSVPAAAAAGCSVTNAATGVRSGSLSAAVSTASAGQTLRISGTCTGNVTIDRRLTLVGVGRNPTLRGNVGRPLTVIAGPTTIVGLRVTGGLANTCVSTPGLACGGGILTSVRLTLRRTTVDGNSTIGSAAAVGGGIHVTTGGSLVLDRSAVAGNTVTAGAGIGQGGGIAAFGPVQLTRSRVATNTVIGATALGGGLSVDGRLTLVESTVDDNTASGDTLAKGGGIHVDGPRSVTITRSTISRNVARGTNTGFASGLGGGLEAADATVNLANVTVSGNRAESAAIAVGNATGGGLHLSLGSIIGSTIAGNTALRGGGLNAESSGVQIGTTILAGNSASLGRDCSSAGVLSSGGRNLVGSGDGCGGTFVNGVKGDLVGTDAAPRAALLGPLAANGGPTRTRLPKPGSPAIDGAGRKPCTTTTDQRRVKRPQGPRCDIGAVERRTRSPF